MNRCANCFTPTPPDRSAWRCAEPGCAQHVPAGPDDDPADDLVQGHAATPRGVPSTVLAPTCSTCGSTCAEVCPTCRYRLPAGWRGARTVCVAMAGARATGKSIYIAVALKQLEQLSRWGTVVRAADAATAEVFATNYERPLYDERNILSYTATVRNNDAHQRTPLVYSVRSPDGQQWFLALRDVAGEDLEPPNQLDAAQLSFFSRADGVVFLFDPLAVPAVRARLHDLVPTQATGADPAVVLDRTLQLIGAGRPRLAVVLSKFDAVQSLARVADSPWATMMRNPGAGYQRDPGDAAYDEHDGRLVHEEVRSLLHRLGAGGLVGRLEALGAVDGPRHRFFAVSALGEAPTGEALHGRGIAPFRCLDPIKWLLREAAS